MKSFLRQRNFSSTPPSILLDLINPQKKKVVLESLCVLVLRLNLHVLLFLRVVNVEITFKTVSMPKAHI